jgi:hypothetical protein
MHAVECDNIDAREQYQTLPNVDINNMNIADDLYFNANFQISMMNGGD